MAGLWESKEISWSNIGVAPWQMKGAHKGRSRCALGEKGAEGLALPNRPLQAPARTRAPQHRNAPGYPSPRTLTPQQPFAEMRYMMVKY